MAERPRDLRFSAKNADRLAGRSQNGWPAAMAKWRFCIKNAVSPILVAGRPGAAMGWNRTEAAVVAEFRDRKHRGRRGWAATANDGKRAAETIESLRRDRVSMAKIQPIMSAS